MSFIQFLFRGHSKIKSNANGVNKLISKQFVSQTQVVTLIINEMMGLVDTYPLR